MVETGGMGKHQLTACKMRQNVAESSTVSLDTPDNLQEGVLPGGISVSYFLPMYRRMFLDFLHDLRMYYIFMGP